MLETADIRRQKEKRKRLDHMQNDDAFVSIDKFHSWGPSVSLELPLLLLWGHYALTRNPGPRNERQQQRRDSLFLRSTIPNLFLESFFKTTGLPDPDTWVGVISSLLLIEGD